MKCLFSKAWTDYELIDSGKGEKLERFGTFVLRRPEPQAVWAKMLPEKEWQRLTDARFVQMGSSSGNWEKSNPKMPDQWKVRYKKGKMNLQFRLGLTGFKHIGLFPEHAANWDFIYEQCRLQKTGKVLNLFAYTGGASLAAKAGGLDVIHCDSIKQVVNWANENMELSNLRDIRWLVEDAYKFVKREVQRGNKYQGIILDPPAWGHGPKGEKWKLEDQINELVENIARLLDPQKSFLVLNAYSLGYSSTILGNLIFTHFGEEVFQRTELGELVLPERSGRKLPAGVVARFGRPIPSKSRKS